MTTTARQKSGYVVAAIIIIVGLFQTNLSMPAVAQAYSSVPGQSYEVCDEQAQYLTSPWTYDALASGSQTYDVTQYEALTGYGTALPPLPSYITNQDPTTEAAVIYAPGATVNLPGYDFPGTPIMYFFEGGSYGPIGYESVTGDEFIGGSAPGFPEPIFNDAGGADGIGAQDGSYDYSGGSSTLTANAHIGDTAVTVAQTIPGYINNITFSDGSSYAIASQVGTTVTLQNPLTTTEASGSAVWANVLPSIAEVVTGGPQGGTSVTLGASTVPLMKYGNVVIGSDSYQVTSISGTQAGYTVTVAGLDTAVSANTPVYYNGLAGDVTVSYLNINNDQHNTTGTIYTGTGWTVTHNDIHDGYSTPGNGVAIYGGDQGVIDYNCLSKMGDYGVNIFGTNNQFDYNEVYESNYEPDPGCGCSGGGKWWGTLNADIEDDAFINDSPGGGGPIWLDNGNSGTLITGNFFDMSYGSAVESETGFNLDVTGNLFLDGGWGNGTGSCGGSNCAGAVNINSSGGTSVPGSRYENQIAISNNQFINNWMGIDIWQAGGRSCENSGEGWPYDAPYCSGGYPNTATTQANPGPGTGAQATGVAYNFSHLADSNNGGGTTLAGDVQAGSSTVLVAGPEAIDDQIGFTDPASTGTTDTTNVATFNGTQTIAATTTGFPTSGKLRVGTSAAWEPATGGTQTPGGGSWTGAILSYNGVSGGFQNVSLVSGTGTLSGPILQVQPYKITAETCYSNDCALTVSPSVPSTVASGTAVTNAGTCQLYATSTALPSGPIAPDGISYFDGCQWEARGIAVSGNTFIFQPSVIANSAPLNGGTTTSCTAANADSCGTNFMADQFGGEAPFDDETDSNSMMSSSTFTGCPAWDAGCTTNPLANLNAGSNPPNAQVGNGEAPANNVWSNNTYEGPWSWTADIFGNCGGGGVVMPSDSSTGHSLTSAACTVNYPQWKSDWQQDTSSTYNPTVVALSGLSADQEIHGAAQPVSALEDTATPGGITSQLQVSGQTTQTLTTAPYNFSLNTLNYPDGPYTLTVNGKDTSNNVNSDTVTPVYVSNGDLTGTGNVSLPDLSILASHWLQTDPSYTDGNITGNSTINLSDLAVMAANWGWSKP
jgi:hypothetical protein